MEALLMKKTLILSLALLLVLPLSLLVPAAAESAPIYLDLSEVLEESGFLSPGETYYIPVMYGNYTLHREELERYRFTVKVENTTADEDRSSSRASASLALIGDYRYLKFSTGASVANKANQEFTITINCYDKVDKEYTDPAVEVVEVGFSSSEYVNESSFTVDNSAAVVEFSDSLTDCLITFPDGSRFAAVLVPNSRRNQDEGILRRTNLYSTTSPVLPIENKYPNEDLEYLTFASNTTFGDNSILRVYAPDMKYIYRIKNQNTLEKINFTRSGDYLVFTTKTLDSYVMSPRELSATTSTTTGSTTGSAPAPSSPGATLSAATAGAAADTAFAARSPYVRFVGIGSVPLEAMQSVATKARAKGLSALVYFDTLNASGGVTTRIYAYPATVTKGFNASASYDDATATSVRNTFSRWFKNKVAVLNLGQSGDFGTKVEVATLMNLSGMDTKHLRFYSYNSARNTYAPLAAPSYWIDNAGYLHFSTTVGGAIVVSEGPLTSV
jgi:hypothetical protein